GDEDHVPKAIGEEPVDPEERVHAETAVRLHEQDGGGPVHTPHGWTRLDGKREVEQRLVEELEVRAHVAVVTANGEADRDQGTRGEQGGPSALVELERHRHHENRRG